VEVEAPDRHVVTKHGPSVWHSDDRSQRAGESGQLAQPLGREVGPPILGSTGGVQVPVQEALPAPQPVDGEAGIEPSRLHRVGELIQVKQTLVPPSVGTRTSMYKSLTMTEPGRAVTWTRSTYQVPGPIPSRLTLALHRQGGSDMLTPRSSSTNTRSRSVRPGQGMNRLDSPNS
jgi:hypothetical protein